MLKNNLSKRLLLTQFLKGSCHILAITDFQCYYIDFIAVNVGIIKNLSRSSLDSKQAVRLLSRSSVDSKQGVRRVVRLFLFFIELFIIGPIPTPILCSLCFAVSLSSYGQRVPESKGALSFSNATKYFIYLFIINCSGTK